MAKGMTTNTMRGFSYFPGTKLPAPTVTPTVRAATPKPAPKPAPKPVKPKQIYNQDANANLREAVIRGNEENTRTIGRFEGTARGLADQFNQGSTRLNQGMNTDMNDAYQGYDSKIRGLMGEMGTASQDTLGRMRGQAYAGLDSGFAMANDDLQAQMAARGLTGSGIFAKGLGDLAQQKMNAGMQANVNAYDKAVAFDDTNRTNKMNTEGNLYGALQSKLQGAYGRKMGQLGQNYGNKMGIEGQIMQNQLNNTQQRQANLMGYAQLGRGMQGMSQNYLASAGSGYQNIGQIAGQSAAQQGQLNNSYNSTMQQANANQQAGKGSMAGSAIGAAAMFSDIRLKDNVVKVGEIDGHNIYTWDWNEEAEGIVDDQPRFGVIAQEVQETNPDAVVEDLQTGYLKVNYPMLFGGGVYHG